MRRFALLFAHLAAFVSIAGHASAYCRSSTCPPNAEEGIQGAQCEPHEDTDCGTPLKWQRDCIGITVQKDGSREIDAETARKIVLRAFNAWESADCGKGSPGIAVIDMGFVDCDRVEYEPRAGNANILIFRDDEWQENGYDKLALTTVNFDKETGELWNADIEVNTHDYTYKEGKHGGDNELIGVLTHETGHFLGMAHTPDPTATMYSTYHEDMAKLQEDDVIGICAAYPPRQIDTATCNPIPRHGFSPLCASDQTEGRCGVAGIDGRTEPGEAPVLPLAAAIGILALRRRRARVTGAGSPPPAPPRPPA